MKLKSLLLPILALSGSLSAATVQNVRMALDENDRLVVRYDLTGAEAADIHLSVSEDGGQNYDTPLSVSGDVGPNIAPGSGKRIVWDILADTPKLQTDKLVARVSTVAPEALLTQPAAKPKTKPAVEKIPRGKQERIPKFKPTKSPGEFSRPTLMLQSAVIPGWGQLSVHKQQGYAYLPAIAAGLGAAFWGQSLYDDQKSKYYAALADYNRPGQTYRQRAQHYDAMKRARDDMDFYRNVNLAGLAAAGIVYAWNLLEVSTIDLGLSPTHAGLSLNVKF